MRGNGRSEDVIVGEAEPVDRVVHDGDVAERAGCRPQRLAEGHERAEAVSVHRMAASQHLSETQSGRAFSVHIGNIGKWEM